MVTIVLLLLAAALGSFAPDAAAQPTPPAIYVDRGACPFECCTYREWKTEKTTTAFARPDPRAPRVGELTAGTTVVALTGEVHTTPGRFTIRKAHGRYKPGDVLWVYTPLGEGMYKVWFKGRMFEEELTYMSGPFEQALPRCEDAADCWGKLDKELRAVWWVKVRSAEGWIGWTNQADHFSNKDACG